MKQLINKSTITSLLSGIIAFFATCYLPYLVDFKESSAFTNNILSIAVYILFFSLIISMISDENKIQSIWLITIDIIYAFSLVTGARISIKGSVNFSSTHYYFCIFIYSLIFHSVNHWLFKKIDTYNSLAERKVKVQLNIQCRNTGGGVPFSIFLFLLAAWMPVWLAVYPGLFVYDATYAFNQVISGQFDSAHPLLHTIILGNLVRLGKNIFNSYNIGIASYIWIQMFLMAGCFTYVIVFLSKRSSNRVFTIAAFFYYTLFPVISITAGCTTKDVLYSGFALLLILCIFLYVQKPDEYLRKYINRIVFTILCFLFLCLRNTSIYIFLFFFGILIVFMRRRDTQKMLAKCCGSVMILWFIYSGLLICLHISNANTAVAFSIPSQQLARTYCENGDSLTDYEKETLFEILPEYRFELYTPKLADPINAGLDMEQLKKDPLKYLKLYLMIGVKNKSIYINSFLENTLGYWYPNTVIDGYTQYYAKTKSPGYQLYENSSYFANITEEPGIRHSKIPVLEKIVDSLTLKFEQRNIPVVSMLFSPGFIFWILIFSFSYSLYTKNAEKGFSLLFVLIIIMLCMAGPIALVRYCLILFYALPIFSAFLFSDR